MKKIDKFYRVLLYLAPVMFFFSFWPALNFGKSNTTHYKIPLVLVWLVIFDIVSIILLFKKKLFKNIKKYYYFLLFPVFATISLIWSPDRLRGLLMVGFLWLIIIAIFSVFLLKKEYFNKKFKKNFLKIFFGSSVAIGVYCIIQCIMDIFGVSREITLACPGCTYMTFGFPHPNGFAIEPQFMGNLLLAPTMLAGYYMLRDKKYVWLFAFLTSALFLTFSRGAIYAFILSMLIYTVVKIFKTKKWHVLWLWPVIILAFLFTLNLQGIFAQISKTNDTYFTGIAKVIDQLSLGKIDLRKIGNQNNEPKDEDVTDKKDEEGISSTFDGYVEVSTNDRVGVNDAMLATWKRDFTTVMFGAGFGGAGVAMYEAGEMDAPGEGGQNFYFTTLLETGLVGILLFMFAIFMIVKIISKNSGKEIILTLGFAYAITLMFFAGYINAVHVFLLPVILLAFFEGGVPVKR